MKPTVKVLTSAAVEVFASGGRLEKQTWFGRIALKEGQKVTE